MRELPPMPWITDPPALVRLPPVIVELLILTVDEVSVEMVPGLVPGLVALVTLDPLISSVPPTFSMLRWLQASQHS